MLVAKEGGINAVLLLLKFVQASLQHYVHFMHIKWFGLRINVACIQRAFTSVQA